MEWRDRSTAVRAWGQSDQWMGLGGFLSPQLPARTVTRSPGKSAAAEGLGQGVLGDSSASFRVQGGQG